MVNTVAEHWREMMPNPWETIVWAYLIVGFVVVFYVVGKYRLSRRSREDPFPWPRRENPQRGLWLFLMVGSVYPILFLAQVALWPLWLFWNVSVLLPLR